MKAILTTTLLGVLATSSLHAQNARLDLSKGDRVALIGNALADRQQHHGWLETMVHQANPEHDLVFRNLGFATDEVVTRMRSENFGTPDEWLAKVKADVILAFFGFNESFQGPEGLPKFKADLLKFLQNTKAQNYGGKGAPRIVLCSPIAFENHRRPNLPDGATQNANLQAYTGAMAEVAKAEAVQFIDLYGLSQKLFAEAKEPLTFNGAHLTVEGERQLAPHLYQALFGKPAPSTETAEFARLRQTVLEKNALWHSRYRTMDGYNVYGGRSGLAYAPGVGPFKSDTRNAPAPYISNYKVMQEEMAVRDVMTANRDQRVWAAARGADLRVDDSNIPPVTRVPTNKRGENPDGTHKILGGEEAIAKMTVPQGCKVNLFADEKQFPGLANPVQMAWDTKGRLWVASWVNYPERTPWSKEGDSLMVFEDTDADGRADKATKFLDDLNCPTGFQFYKDGVLLMQAPDMWFVRDTDGDGKGDWKERVLMGLDSADSHHTTNAVCYEPGGAIYLSDGVFHRTQVETINGPVRNEDGCIYRYEPQTHKFERYMPYGFANPHGRIFDTWGNDIITDATGNANYFGPAASGFIDEPHTHAGMKEFWQRPSRPCAGTAMLSSRHFPDAYNGNFLNANVISIQGIFRVKVTEDGSGQKGETLENLITSTDPNFRPAAVSVGPDGAVYFCDWHNPIIGHMQHHIRDESRDHAHGRVYRITYEGRDLLKPAKIAGEPIEKLLELLKEPEDNVRERAKVELHTHDSQAVTAATKSWAKALDKAAPNYEHHRLEALWVHQWHNVADESLLREVLASPDHRARAQAVRVLCYWRDRVPGALALIKTAAMDEHPRVRLEAVRACSFFREASAADAALCALRKPTDYYIDYCLKETMRQLEQWWKPAISAGQPIAADNPAGVNYVMATVDTADLRKLPKTPLVYTALLSRPNVPEIDRLEAVTALATQSKKSQAAHLLELIQAEGTAAPAAEDLARMALRLPAEEFRAPAMRQSLETLVAEGKATEVALRTALAALILADGSADQQWAAAKSPMQLKGLLNALATVPTPEIRAAAFEKVRPLLSAYPPEIEAAIKSGQGGGRYVRVTLPRRGTLTLAEVQVMSEGQNIAARGSAKQSSTSNGGYAKNAIDGNTNGQFGAGGQTHSRENERDSWWELDLGQEYPIGSVTIWNRTDGDLGKRLRDYTLTVLDGARNELFKAEKQPAPEESATIAVNADFGGALRRSAIRALISTGQKPELIFADLSGLIQKGQQLTAAAQALNKLPRQAWGKEPAASAAKALVAWAKGIPAAARTSQDYIETVQVANELAGLLPSEEAAAQRKTLRELRVSVFVVKTVREQLRFDTTRLVVEAGKPFEVIFENDDVMPHNLLIVKPGTRDKAGLATATMLPSVLDSQGRAYVPSGDIMIAGTKLLEPNQKETLKLTAPTEPGEYDYVCTFPGHYTIMWGKLIVAKDVDAALRGN